MLTFKRMKSSFSSISFNLHGLNERASGLKKGEQMQAFLQVKEFIQNSSIVPLFMVVFTVLGFIPFLVFATFVSSSFLVLAMSVLIVFGGTLMATFVSILIVVFPALLLGTGIAFFVYLTFYGGVCILHLIKHLQRILKSFGLNQSTWQKLDRLSGFLYSSSINPSSAPLQVMTNRWKVSANICPTSSIGR